MELFHGTVRSNWTSISAGVNIHAGRTRLDFGQGFYTTTSLSQARRWAKTTQQRQRTRSAPAVIRFSVDRDALAKLEWLGFVRGTITAVDFWLFVNHCRSGGVGHGRVANANQSRPGWYDVVIGPLVLWPNSICRPDSEQISFHSQATADLLNTSPKGLI